MTAVWAVSPGAFQETPVNVERTVQNNSILEWIAYLYTWFRNLCPHKGPAVDCSS